MRVGDAVVQREVMGGYVWSAVPAVVARLDGVLGLYRPAGTTCWWPSHPRGEHRPFDEVTQRGAPWAVGKFAGLLTLIDAGADFSTSLMWNHDWSFWGWYIDFIRPYRETPIGWDFSDVHLDLIVDPTGAVTVKDEADLEEAVARGEVSQSESDDARRRCEHLMQQAAQGSGIFSYPWPDWRPDKSWPLPALSEQASESLQASPTPADARLEPGWWLRREAL